MWSSAPAAAAGAAARCNCSRQMPLHYQALYSNSRTVTIDPASSSHRTREFVGWYEKRPNETFWERTLHSSVEVYDNVARVTSEGTLRSALPRQPVPSPRRASRTSNSSVTDRPATIPSGESLRWSGRTHRPVIRFRAAICPTQSIPKRIPQAKRADSVESRYAKDCSFPGPCPHGHTHAATSRAN